MTAATGATASRTASPDCRSACCAAPGSTRRSAPRASPPWNEPRRCWPMRARRWTRHSPTCRTRARSSPAYGARRLSRLVATMPEQLRGLLDPGIHEVARALGGMSADASTSMARRCARPPATPWRGCTSVSIWCCVRRCRRVRRWPTRRRPIRWRRSARQWAPWTFTFNLTRQPAIAVPMGVDADGLPLSVQLAAAQYRDDLVLRAARALEQAAPFATVAA